MFGESYAGHYIPQFAYDFIRNKNFTKINFRGTQNYIILTNLILNLLIGISIGDPLIDG